MKTASKIKSETSRTLIYDSCLILSLVSQLELVQLYSWYLYAGGYEEC